MYVSKQQLCVPGRPSGLSPDRCFIENVLVVVCSRALELFRPESEISTPPLVFCVSFLETEGEARRRQSIGDTGEKVLAGLNPRPAGGPVVPESGIYGITPWAHS